MSLSTPSGYLVAPATEQNTWRGVGVLLWLCTLALLPLVIADHVDPALLSARFVEPKGHVLLEGFCSIMALLIGALLLAIGIRQGDHPVVIFAGAFFCMGILDGVHALSDPLANPDVFVLSHTFSALCGGTLILLGTLAELLSARGFPPRATAMTVVLAGVVSVAAVTWFCFLHFHTAFSDTRNNAAFSTFARGMHDLAAVFFGAAAIAFHRTYTSYKGIPAIVISGLVIVFACSVYLFGYSHIWDFTWWLWHGGKVFFYLCVMALVFAGFMIAINALVRSRKVLAGANRRLRHAQCRASRMNRELAIRNDVVRGAMASQDLHNAFRTISQAVDRLMGGVCCQLVLKIPADEAGEFSSLLSSINRGLGTAGHCACSGIAVFAPGNRRDPRACACGCASVVLPLSAEGEEAGYLRLAAPNTRRVDKCRAELESLAAEAGPIVNNALSHHRWRDANAFTSALLRVSAMLTSTLDLERVLQAVCRESASLLESDGAMVWLPGDGSEPFTLVSICPGGDHAMNIHDFVAWIERGVTERGLLRSEENEFQPETWLRTDGEVIEGCHYGALALFPLVEKGELLGVMALARSEPIQYSTTTLAKGMLLAGQVRIAINNARSYRELCEKNRQIELAEQRKRRDEHLALLGQMAASVAHEVRNPLSAISNCLTVLKAEPAFHGAGKAGAALEIIHDEVQRLNKLTRDFLTFGRQGESTLKPVHIEAVMRRLGSALERHVAQEGLAVTVECAPEEGRGPVLFDPEGLETVLWNLLLNGVQAVSDEGRVRLSNRFSRRHLLFVIRDTGRGIAAEDRCHVFEPFFSRRSHGAGLGLAIVQRFVEAWHGRIRVLSRPGAGTTFLIRIPLVAEETQ